MFASNNVVRAIVPSLQVEGIDFNVTDLPQQSRLYASDGTTQIGMFYAQNRIVVPFQVDFQADAPGGGRVSTVVSSCMPARISRA